MLQKLLCFIGWHEFSWLLPEDGVINLSGPPPDHATCLHCGVRYKNEAVEP